MDSKSNSDTNNNEALRLANHDISAGPTPSTSGIAQLIKEVDRVTENGGHRNSSPPSHDEEVPKLTDGSPTEDEFILPLDGSTEATGKNPKSSGHIRANCCNLCGKKCWKASDLKRHLVYHLRRKPFKCNVSSRLVGRGCYVIINIKST